LGFYAHVPLISRRDSIAAMAMGALVMDEFSCAALDMSAPILSFVDNEASTLRFLVAINAQMEHNISSN
jgi:hypothetical protein